MGKPNPVRPVEHQDVLVGTEETVIERITEAQRGKTFVEHRPGVRRELELGLVPDMQDGALVVVRLSAELHPALVITEVNRLVLRGVDIARPEKPDVAVRKDMLVGFAPKRQVDVVRSGQLESRPALQMKCRGLRLMEFGLALGNLRERHRGVARLEGDRAIAPQVLVAVEDVLQVQPRYREERLRIGSMSESMHA